MTLIISCRFQPPVSACPTRESKTLTSCRFQPPLCACPPRKLAAGLDDAFLAFIDPGGGTVTGGWQFGGATSERLYALRVDEETGDVIVGGYTTGALFATNGGLLPLHRDGGLRWERGELIYHAWP